MLTRVSNTCLTLPTSPLYPYNLVHDLTNGRVHSNHKAISNSLGCTMATLVLQSDASPIYASADAGLVSFYRQTSNIKHDRKPFNGTLTTPFSVTIPKLPYFNPLEITSKMDVKSSASTSGPLNHREEGTPNDDFRDVKAVLQTSYTDVFAVSDDGTKFVKPESLCGVPVEVVREANPY